VANYPPDWSREHYTERRRVLGIFCDWREAPDGPPLGERPYDTLRTFHLVRFLDLLTHLAAATRRRWSATIKACMNTAARLGFIDRSPFGETRLPLGKVGRDWTDTEYQTVLRHAPPPFRRLLVFLRFSGARPGEARTAQWENLDAEARVINLHKHKTQRITGKIRRIRLSHVTLKLLRWLSQHAPPQRHIFLNQHDRPWTIHAITKQLRTIRQRAGLPGEVKIHGLRHTFCTRGLTNEVDIGTMSVLLGHANVTMTQRYAHLVNKSPYLDAALAKAIGGNGSAPAALQAVPATPDVAALLRAQEERWLALFDRLTEKVRALEQSHAAPPRAAPPAPQRAELPPAVQIAHEALKWAVQMRPDLAGASDAEVYAWLQGRAEYQGQLAPTAATFRRQLNEARRFYHGPGGRKGQRRNGFSGPRILEGGQP
jgi:integrase